MEGALEEALAFVDVSREYSPERTDVVETTDGEI